MKAAEGVRCGLHEHTPDPMALKPWLDANLRGVPNSIGNFAGEYGADQIVTAWMTKNKGCAWLELAAARKQDDVFQEFQSSIPGAVLIVDFTVDVIGIRQKNELRAGVEVAIMPAIQFEA